MKFKLTILAFFSMFSVVVWADYAPSKVQAAFKKMYPKVTYPDWSQERGYYVGDFMQNGYDTSAWFDANANWIMTQTDWETLDNVPGAIYNAFSQGEYSNGQIEDVTLIEFPKCPSVVVIEVEAYNEDMKVQLFYSQDGELLQTRNLGYLEDTLWPDLFNCN